MVGVKNMKKYDKMLALNKEHSEEKITRAKKAIFRMMDVGEKVTVPKLMEKTGLSRGFFYKNQIVRKEIDRAMQQQVGMVDPKRYIGDMALKKKIEIMQQHMHGLEVENEKLKKENKSLKKALDRKELDMVKNL